MNKNATKTHSTLIKQMQNPEFYSHWVQSPIELNQTHASIILLTGDYAYKLKKPVDFKFLDFSTLAKRKYFCHQEYQLNKVISPELYLEVIPITQEADKFVLNGSGEPVEYTLKMRQFPQENLLINRFEQGKLTESEMEELGVVVAQFHAQARTDDYIRSFGEVAQIREAIAQNYQQTEKYIGVAQTEQQFRETKQFTDSFLNQQELFKQRQAADKIKECHGDLHLKNICLWQDKIQLFDRIEFNDSFRFVDVMYDVAFTVMDVEARGKTNLGNAFLNTYLEQTGDWEGLQVLPLYLSRQAYVRAKVNSFLLDDLDQERQTTIQTAANYYRLAWEYTQARQGKLMLMSGLSGSGKTTVARRLARRCHAIHIRSDAVRKHLAGVPLNEAGGDDLYTPQMSDQTYTRLLELGNTLASQGFWVILDAKFERQHWRERAIHAQHHYPVQILHCTAPLDILRDRLAHRTNDISDATAALLQQQQDEAEPFTEAEQDYLINIDTTQPQWEEQLKL